MKIFLIRHGESVGNTKQGFVSGQSDPVGLTKKGRIQIIRSAYELHNESIDGILASPVERARETAQILSFYNGKKIEFLDFLKEINHGVFEGRYWWEVIHKIPLSWTARREDFLTPYPQGESMSMVLERVSEGLANLSSKLDPKGTYIMVSHQAIITTIRYCLNFGNYRSVVSNKKEKEYLDYLHKFKINNGELIKFSGSSFNNLKEISTPKIEKLSSHKKQAEFYARCYLDLDKDASIERVETASSNYAYEVKDKNKDILLKIMSDDNKAPIERQIKLYNFLDKNGVRAPKIIDYDNTTAYFKNHAIVQNYVKGQIFSNCLKQDFFEVKNILEDVFLELQKIHNLSIENVIKFWQPPTSKELLEWKNFMTYNINMSLHKVQNIVSKDKNLSSIKEDMLNLKDYVREERYKVAPLHGDLGTGNIIISYTEPYHFLRFIDFEWVRIGDPLWDLAYLLGFIERKSMQVAKIWFEIVKKNYEDQIPQFLWYRNLFHIWTVRDMLDYHGHDIRISRGKKSLSILKNFPSNFYLD